MCIWKFVQRQLPHLGFCWWYCGILFGYQARIFRFHFPMFHTRLWVSKPEILLNTYILRSCRKQRHIWTSEWIIHCFALCMGVNNTQNYLNVIEEEETCFHTSLSTALYTLFINLSGLILLILLFHLYIFFLYWIHKSIKRRFFFHVNEILDTLDPNSIWINAV